MFDLACRKCGRLARYLDQIRDRHPDYYTRPVPPFGADSPRLLIVGLAPGLHGANRTGRPFTGDYAGVLLYRTLYELGLSNQPESTSRDDALSLRECRISNAVKCVPPQNKPTGAEVRNCNRYLAAELGALSSRVVVVALGTVAHRAVLRAVGMKQTTCRFAHGATYKLSDGKWLVDSYHCSRYNTQTRRLTPAMFKQVLKRALALTDMLQ